MPSNRSEILLCFILASVLYILADVAPMYHTSLAASVHDVYMLLGGASMFIGVVGIVRSWWKE